MNPQPGLSVIIPTHNYGRFLGEAIRSVLSQDWPHPEILVVDDASTDDTPEVAASFAPAVRYLRRETRGGIAAARNHGLKQTTGTLLAFLDSDDAWVAGRLQSLAERLQHAPEAGAVYGLAAQVRTDQFTEALANPAPWAAHAAPGWLGSGMLFRRQAFDQVGPFDESLSTGEFIDWVALARSRGFRFELHPELLLLRRLHDSNTMRTNPRLAQNYGRLLKQHLDRVRQRGPLRQSDPRP